VRGPLAGWAATATDDTQTASAVAIARVNALFIK
jgi:hypothetical protein